jgi:hypothetical protein
MLEISPEALREGCDRARDLFLLNRLQGPAAAARTTEDVFAALGIDPEMREDLARVLADIVPVNGVPALEAAASSGMLAGVLVGLLIADATTPSGELDLPIVQR